MFKIFKEYIINFCCLCGPAWVVNQILVPHTIISGELTGICEILYFATNGQLSIWMSSFGLNLVLLIIAIYLMGWKFCLRTIFGILIMTFWLKIIPITDIPTIDNPILAIITAGIINGIGLGICFCNHGNSGGTDIIAMIVHKYKNIQIGNVLFICDFIIIGSSWFLPQVTEVGQLFLGLLFTFVSASCVNIVTNSKRLKIHFR